MFVVNSIQSVVYAATADPIGAVTEADMNGTEIELTGEKKNELTIDGIMALHEKDNASKVKLPLQKRHITPGEILDKKAELVEHRKTLNAGKIADKKRLVKASMNCIQFTREMRSIFLYFSTFMNAQRGSSSEKDVAVTIIDV